MTEAASSRKVAERLREIAFLEAVRQRCPRHVGTLKALGDLYTRTGRVEDGLRVDLRLVRLCPRDDMVWYNLGCSYALTGHSERAFHALERAVDLGYDDAGWMNRDEDLASLRCDPRFTRLLNRASSTAGADG